MLSRAVFPGSPQEFEIEIMECWRRRRRITAMDDGRTMRVFGEVLIVLATGQRDKKRKDDDGEVNCN